jgi:hypothetical protein
MTDQFAHIEGNVAVIFDGAVALRFLPKKVLRHWLACEHALPPCLRLGGGTIDSFVSRHNIDPMCSRKGQRMSTFARLLDEVELFSDNASRRSLSSKLPWLARAGNVRKLSARSSSLRPALPIRSAERGSRRALGGGNLGIRW